jgi:tetratricopeptide (TPR) repeat protein
MTIHSLDEHRAQKLHEEGQSLYAEGRETEAIKKYLEAIACDPQKSETHYNLGLVYKYQGNWEKSFEFNLTANKLAPDDEAARWNLAIAATALRRWDIARKAWLENEIKLDGDSGPINMNFGQTPVRLNANEDGEVVWAQRIDPVRARILNIPFRGSGFGHEDVVLHDGAAVGHRVREGREYPVFNVLEMFERSSFETCVATVSVTDSKHIEALEEIVTASNSVIEDWTANVQILCRKCSEGIPHDHNDHEVQSIWSNERRLGIARHPDDNLETLLEQWQKQTGAKVISVER